MAGIEKKTVNLPDGDFVICWDMSTAIALAIVPVPDRDEWYWNINEKLVSDGPSRNLVFNLTTEERAYLCGLWKGLPNTTKDGAPLQLLPNKSDFDIFIEAFNNAPDKPDWSLPDTRYSTVQNASYNRNAVLRKHANMIYSEISNGSLAAFDRDFGKTRDHLEAAYIARADAVSYLEGNNFTVAGAAPEGRIVGATSQAGTTEHKETKPRAQSAERAATAPVLNGSQTLFDAELSVREFKTHVLYVPDLLKWAQSKGLHLRTTPPLDGYEFVHIETLLCAIERQATNLTHDQALIIVANDPALRARMFSGLGLEQEQFDSYLKESPAWLVQADAHSWWRNTFAAAIQIGELVALGFGTKAPIVPTPAQGAATPLTAQTHSTKTPRSDTITPAIKLAQSKCADPDDTSQVWAQMEVLADNETAPLLASTDKGLKYRKKGRDAYFTRNALDKRLHPEKRIARKAP